MGFRSGLLMMGVVALVGCQTAPMPVAATESTRPMATTERADTISAFDAPIAWGGEARCTASDCLLGLVEHEAGRVVLHALKGRTVRQLDHKPVAYHPDSAVWLSDTLLAAAVETTASVDVFRIEGERLVPVRHLPVGFGPRDLLVTKADQGAYTLLALPYRGNKVTWIDWRDDGRDPSRMEQSTWCNAPWHPAKVSKIPGMAGRGIAVGCLDDNRVIAVPDGDRQAKPKVLASFGQVVPRYVRPSPSGKWLYVSLETGARNARIDMDSGELQWIASPLTGSVAVAPLSDDRVIWADDGQLYLQQLGADGGVMETRWIKFPGFHTSLQLIDVDGDGERDLVVLGSADPKSHIVYGPLWEKAQPRR